MKRLLKLIKLIDQHILTILLCAFAFIIPLYPKIPLSVVNYTYIAIRLEDYFVAILALVFAIQLLRKKITLSKQFLLPFVLFWAVLFISYFFGYYITRTIPIEFKKVGFYHALRRVEYMMIFFIAMSAIRSVREFKLLLTSSLASLFLVCVYGIVQRFYDFPAIQTMNPEYAKGRIVFLTEEARLSSTFGGHYDLSAYLVLMIPLVMGVYLLTKGFLTKQIKFTEPLTALFELIRRIFFTFSKKLNLLEILKLEQFQLDKKITVPITIVGSLIAILFGLAVKTYELKIALVLIPTLIIFLTLLRYVPSITLFILMILSLFIMTLTSSRISTIAYFLSAPAFLWLMRRYFLAIVVLILSILIMMTNQTLIERFFKTFQIKQFLVNEQTGETHVIQRMKSDELPAGSNIVMKVGKKNTTADEEVIKKEIIAKAATPTPFPLPQVGIKNPIKPIPITQFTEMFAVTTDISFSTRLQVEWPRAIGAFIKSPIIGTGPSSITEATDNDYLRWLGETGILGFGLLIFILFQITFYIIRRANQLPESIRPLFFAPIFGLAGLLINATYIDVFEASKVAFVFWYIMGIYVGILRTVDQNK